MAATPFCKSCYDLEGYTVELEQSSDVVGSLIGRGSNLKCPKCGKSKGHMNCVFGYKSLFGVWLVRPKADLVNFWKKCAYEEPTPRAVRAVHS